MKLIGLTLESPARNLALDEALLDAVELAPHHALLRFWESPTYFVVIGYSKRVGEEVNLAETDARRIPVLRRCSGGGTVLQGPGCLNYSLILPLTADPALATVTGSNRWIMHRNAQALSQLLHREVRVDGHTDLTLDGRKVSGNAQRRKRNALLFHGTFLLDFDPDLMEALLRLPREQPAYRDQRRHSDFLTRLPPPATPATVRQALAQAWNACEPTLEWPTGETARLALEKYASDTWNRRL